MLGKNKKKNIILFTALFIFISIAHINRSSVYAQVMDAIQLAKTICLQPELREFTGYGCVDMGKEAFNWVKKYSTVAFDHLTDEVMNKSVSSKNAGLWSKIQGLSDKAANSITENISGDIFLDAQKDLITPKYFQLVQNIRLEKKSEIAIFDERARLEVDSQWLDDDNIVLPGINLSIDNPIQMGADDANRMIAELDRQLIDKKKDLVLSYRLFSQFLLTHYGLKIGPDALDGLLGRVDGENILETVVLFRAAKMIDAKIRESASKYPKNSMLQHRYLSLTIFLQETLMKRLDKFAGLYSRKWLLKLAKIRTKTVDILEQEVELARDLKNKSRRIHKHNIHENKALLRLIEKYEKSLKTQSSAIESVLKDLRDRIVALRKKFESDELRRTYTHLVAQSSAEFEALTALRDPQIFIPKTAGERRRLNKLSRELFM